MEDRLGSESPELRNCQESSFSLLLLLQLKNQRLCDIRKKQLHGFVPAAYMVLTHKLVRQTTAAQPPGPVGHSRLFAQSREELCGLSSVQPVQTGLSGCWQHVHCWRMGDIAKGRARFSQQPLRTGQEWFLEFSNHTLGGTALGIFDDAPPLAK